jgi:hypothetical protein
MEIFEWDENIPVTANNLNEMQNKMIENIESANESNDNYLKLIDGTLICWGKTNKYNIEYQHTENVDITLPVSYKDANYIVLTSIADIGAFWANGLTTAGYSTSTNNIRVCLSNYQINSTIQSVSASWITIGRWK